MCGKSNKVMKQEPVQNPIEDLEDDIFMRRNLLNLQAITLASCEIKSIQVHAFR